VVSDAAARLRVVRGNPTDAELAAVTVVLLAVAGRRGTDPPTPPARAAWGRDLGGFRPAGSWTAPARHRLP
jgi:Acyl-CoA carboxylase epsilon subunit